MASTDIFVAKESFATELDGQPIIVHKGTTRVRAGHPLLKGRESLFEPITVEYDVEQATARPGELRGAPAAPTAAERRAAKAEVAKDEAAAEAETETES